MPGVRSTRFLSDGVAVRLDELVTAVGVTDWVLMTGRVEVQCTGVATAATVQLERASADPAAAANPAPLGGPVNGNPAAGMAVIQHEIGGAAWLRVRVTALTGASVAIALTGRGVATPAAIMPDRTAPPRLARLRLGTTSATAGVPFEAQIEGRTAGSELRLVGNPGGRWTLSGTTLTGRDLRRGVETPVVREDPGTTGALSSCETEFRVTVAHDPSVRAFLLPNGGRLAGIVSGTRRTVTNGQNVGAYNGGAQESVRVWDNSNVNCRNPRAYFHMGRTNPVNSGLVEYPLTVPKTRLRYAILTGLTDRTAKDQSSATELAATWYDIAADPVFAGWGGTVSADGLELTTPPLRVVEAMSWANNVMTVTVAGSAAGIEPGQVIEFAGAVPASINTQRVVASSEGAAGKTFTFEDGYNHGAVTTMPTMARSWLVYSDKFAGWNAKQPNGYFHKVLHIGAAFQGRIANLPAMRADLGDLSDGNFFSNNWTGVTNTKNCLIPYLLGEGDAGAKLIVVDGDSITSQNGGTFLSGIDIGDADGVLCSVKQALNINRLSWIDISVPGSGADVRVSTFNPVATAANVRNHRYSVFLPLADVVLSRMLHNDRRSWSTNFDNGLRVRYQNDNIFLRSRMKPGARLGRVTLFGSLGMPRFTAISQTGTVASGTLPTAAGLSVGDQFEVNLSAGATASLGTDFATTAISQTGNVIRLTTPTTVGMTVGDRLRFIPSGVYATSYAFTRDSSGLVVITGIVDATTFTVASPRSQTRSDTFTNYWGGVRRIKSINGNVITWDNPAGLEGAAALGSGGTTFNNRWRTVEVQIPGNDDSDMGDMSNPNKGGVARLNDLMMRRGPYANIAYGGPTEIDFAVDGTQSIQDARYRWKSDGSDYCYAQDPTHPGTGGHAVEGVALAPQIAANL